MTIMTMTMKLQVWNLGLALRLVGALAAADRATARAWLAVLS